MTSRRQVIHIASLFGTAVATAGLARHLHAQGATVDEKDPTAVALGYVADAAKVDKAKYPKYAAGQHCGGCQLYQGAAGSATGPCSIFAGKQVASKGWCSAYVAKA